MKFFDLPHHIPLTPEVLLGCLGVVLFVGLGLAFVLSQPVLKIYRRRIQVLEGEMHRLNQVCFDLSEQLYTSRQQTIGPAVGGQTPGPMAAPVGGAASAHLRSESVQRRSLAGRTPGALRPALTGSGLARYERLSGTHSHEFQSSDKTVVAVDPALAKLQQFVSGSRVRQVA